MGAGHLKSGSSRIRGSNPSYEIFKGGELRGLSHFMRLVPGSLSVSALTFLGSEQLLSCRLIFLNRLVCDHDCLGYYSDIVLQH